jgi:hypothetical protein
MTPVKPPVTDGNQGLLRTTSTANIFTRFMLALRIAKLRPHGTLTFTLWKSKTPVGRIKITLHGIGLNFEASRLKLA